jgi:hypothetical protein
MKNKENFELILLPGKCLPGGIFSELYDAVYAKWKETWLKVFTDVGSPQAWNADTFFRGDMIPVILHEGKIAAFYLATTYSLQSAWVRDHSYFSIYPKSAIDRLLDHGVRNVMSYEYMTVLPEYRKSRLGFSLGGVLAELGLSVREELACDAGVGVALLSHKVDQIAHNVGGFTLVKEARRGNLVCEIVGFLKQSDQPYPERQVHELAEYLWKSKISVNRFGNSVAAEKLPLAG